MANVNIAEFSGIAARGGAQVPNAPPLNVQNVAIGGGSVQSAAFSTATSLVRVCADAIAWVAFGSNPTAIANGAGTVRLVANLPEYFAVPGGSMLAVITGS